MESFVAGLPPDFRLRLKFEGCDDLTTTYQTAIKIEKEMEREKTRFQEVVRNAESYANAAGQRKSKSSFCDHCKKSEHVANDCFIKHPEKKPRNSEKTEGRDREQQNNDRPRNNEKNRPTCTYCKYTGHTEGVCHRRLREIENSVNAKQPSAPQGASRKDNAKQRPVNTVQTNDECEPSTSD